MKISESIRKLRLAYNMTQTEFGKIAGVSDKAVSTWENGTAEPRMGAVERIANHFGIKKSDVIEGTFENPHEDSPYYLNEDVRDIADFLQKNPNYKVLFDATRKVKPEDIEFVKEMIDRMTGGDADG